MAVLASANFNQANQNPILAPWVTEGGFVAGQIFGSQYIGQNAGSTGNIFDGGVVWPVNQFSQATLQALSNGIAVLGVRWNAANSDSYAILLEAQNPGSGIGFPTQVLLQKILGGVVTNLDSVFVTPQAGDVFKIEAVDAKISVFQNNVPIASAVDFGVTTGKPGLGTFPVAAATTVAWDDWSGGSTVGKTITGTWQDPEGNPVAFGTLNLKLTQDAVVSATSMIAPSIISITLDASGSIPAGTVIYGSDELTPSNLAYVVTVAEKGGGQVYGPEFFIISGTSPINMNSLAPSSNSPVVFSQAVLQNPTAAQTITGFPLTITSALTVQGQLLAQGGETVGATGVNGSITLLGGTSGSANLATDSLGKALQTSRIRPILGTAYSGADAAIVPNAVNGAGGWGVGAAVSAAVGFDGAFSFTITAAGAPGASPTCVVTFKDGTWINAPQCIVKRNDTTAPVSSGPDVIWTTTATTLTFTFTGTPVAANTYKFVCIGIGN